MQDWVKDDADFGPGTFTLPLCYFSTQVADLRFRLHYSHLIPLSCEADLIPCAKICQ